MHQITIMHLSIENITKKYENHVALNDISVQIPENQIFGLLGPNGAGKTTLIRIITQITAADSGRICINNRPIQPTDVYNMGYLPEERGLYKKMKVGEQCLFFAQLKGMSKQDATRQLKCWFEKFDIGSWWNRKLDELSKGMQQKVQFITTVVHKPRLIILDEPFSGFDPVNSSLIKNEVLELKANGTTVILSTHDMNSVEELCDEIALLNQAKIMLQGNIGAIRQQHKSNMLQIRIAHDELFKQEELPPDFEIISQQAQDNYIDLRIHNKAGISNNELIRQLLNQYEILSFKEEIPTMNELFIQTVKTKS